MKATLTIEVPNKGCHHKCPLCVTAHEPISYEIWYQCKVNNVECGTENCPLEIKEVDDNVINKLVADYKEVDE